MELKLPAIWDAAFERVVLIVPLWNWNDAKQQYSTDHEGSNCTFMELKYRFGAVLSKETLVLIVPLWNWNLRVLSGI